MTAPGNHPTGPEDTSRPVDMSRYRRTQRPQPRTGRATEVTTSLTGWILGNRGRAPQPAAEPKARTASVITVLVLTLTILVAVAVGVTYLAWGWISSP